MDFLDELNSVISVEEKAKTPLKKIGELTVGQEYKHKSSKLIKTKFGVKLAATLSDGNDEFFIFLPDRFSKFTKTQIEKMNNDQELKLVYNGLKDLTNGYKTHDFTFKH